MAEFGRALVNPESISTPGTAQKLIGSLMIFEAPTLEEVKKTVEDDIYYLNGVVSGLVAIVRYQGR